MLCLPTDAKNVVTKSSAGAILTSDVLGTAGSSLLVNTSLPAYLATGQTVQISVEYNLPSFSVGSNRIMRFPTFNYVVDKASFIITMPEGATISTSDPSASVTTSGYEQKLTLTRNSVSYVDYSTPNYDYIQFDYSYSPFWSSYKPTIIVFGFSAVGCAGIILWTNKRKPEGEKKLAKAPVIVPKKEKPAETKTWTPKTLKTSPELIQKFIDDYELRRELIKEQEALEIKVQKGRIPRSQYKSQNNSLDSRIQGLTNSIHGAEGIFRYSSPELEHLIEKLEEAEAELDEASEQAKSIEMQRKSGEITIEQYKEDIADAEHAKENADSSINDILLQLREKMQ
jgi:hypothetical protein